MKTQNLVLLLIITAFFAYSCSYEKGKEKTSNLSDKTKIDTNDATNDFYDNVETHNLPMVELEIAGEILNPSKIDFSILKKHSVIVKEALLAEDGGNNFVGAYRYDGYSLYDILNACKLNKLNKEDFPPIIDLFVEVENAKGEKVVFSWGEIYYPNAAHRILIASDVARIVPSKTKDLWPLPTVSKLVVANDLLTERNISNPSKITIRSYPKSFKVQKGMNPMYASSFKVFTNDSLIGEVKEVKKGNVITYNSVFYGRGRGIHSTTPFTGIMIKDFLADFFKLNRNDLKNGYFVMVGLDGYRSVVTFSELMNRNDEQEFLLISDKEGTNDGRFRIFPACDFFSDRAIKSLAEVHFIKG